MIYLDVPFCLPFSLVAPYLADSCRGTPSGVRDSHERTGVLVVPIRS